MSYYLYSHLLWWQSLKPENEWHFSRAWQGREDSVGTPLWLRTLGTALWLRTLWIQPSDWGLCGYSPLTEDSVGTALWLRTLGTASEDSVETALWLRTLWKQPSDWGLCGNSPLTEDSGYSLWLIPSNVGQLLSKPCQLCQPTWPGVNSPTW